MLFDFVLTGRRKFLIEERLQFLLFYGMLGHGLSSLRQSRREQFAQRQLGAEEF